jgi:hypothetical protein
LYPATGIAEPPPEAQTMLDTSAPAIGTFSAAASTVGAPPNTAGR